MKKTRRIRRSLMTFRVFSFLVSVGPLAWFFFQNFGRYVETVGDAVKLSMGGMALLVIVVFAVIGKLKIPGRLVSAFVLCALCWSLAALLEDLTIITSIWLGSTVADEMIFSPLVKVTQRRLDIQETADATATATARAVESYLGRT